MKNVRSVVGMIKQSVLKQVKRGGGGVGKGKILYWREGRYNNHCNNRIVLSFLRDIFKSYLSYLNKLKVVRNKKSKFFSHRYLIEFY